MAASLNWSAVGRALEDCQDQAALSDLAALEKSKLPEVIKTSKRQRIPWRPEALRPKKKRTILGTVYVADGVPTAGDGQLAAAIAASGARLSASGVPA